MNTPNSQTRSVNYPRSLLLRLFLTAAGYLITGGAGATIAMREDLAGAFLGKRSGRSARDDFVKGLGTALSPSLSMLLLHLLFIALVLWPGQTRTIGVTGLTVNGVLFAIGMLGEPITYHVYKQPRSDPAKAIIVTSNIVLPLMMIYLGCKALMRT